MAVINMDNVYVRPFDDTRNIVEEWRENEMIWEESNEHIVNGNGFVSFTGNRNRNVKNAVFDGACYQKQLSGKNLCPPLSDWVTGSIDSWKVNVKNDTKPSFPFTFYTSESSAYDNVPVVVVEVFPNTTYTFSTDTGLYIVGSGYARYEDTQTGDNKTISDLGSSQQSPKTFVTTSTTHYMVFGLGASGFSQSITLQGNEVVQLELGSTATAYESYCGGIPCPNPDYPQLVMGNNSVWEANGESVDLSSLVLYGIGDTKDTYDSQNGVVTRKIMKYVFTGTENIIQYSSGSSIYYLDNVLSKANVSIGGVAFGIGLCTHYLWALSTNDKSLTVRFQSGNGLRFYFIQVGITVLSDFKEWLSQQYANGNPVTVYYVLAVPATEQVLPQLIQQHKGENIIRQMNGDIDNAQLTVTYYGR